MTILGPNLFVVGAAKAGTTAMYAYLAKHPEIFMTPVKAPSYFAVDLGVRTAYVGHLHRYLGLFAEGQGFPVRGEASPSYLFDPGAARRIYEFENSARILILLRNPLEAITALHGEARKYGFEPRRDFTVALAASDRGRPRLVARHGGFWTRYRDIVRYADQVERYLDVFPKGQVFIGLYDDLRADPGALYGQVLEFLGVEPTFRPSFAPLNSYRGDVRSYLVQRAAMRYTGRVGADGRGEMRFARLNRAMVRRNIIQRPRTALAPAVRAELVADLRPDVEKLALLLGRDLSGWLLEGEGLVDGAGTAT
jgi:hypothetical protein